MIAKLEGENVIITFPAKDRLSISKSGKSVIVCKVLRPQRVAGTEIFITFTAYIAKSQVDAATLKALQAETSDAA